MLTHVLSRTIFFGWLAVSAAPTLAATRAPTTRAAGTTAAPARQTQTRWERASNAYARTVAAQSPHLNRGAFQSALTVNPWHNRSDPRFGPLDKALRKAEAFLKSKGSIDDQAYHNALNVFEAAGHDAVFAREFAAGMAAEAERCRTDPAVRSSYSYGMAMATYGAHGQHADEIFGQALEYVIADAAKSAP